MINTVVKKLDETALKYPDKIALTDDLEEVTFKQYQHCSKVIASNLIRIISLHSLPVAVYLPKSIACLEAFMAILYSGNFYCPIPFNSPKLRAKSIVESLDFPYIITAYEYRTEVIGFTNHEEQILFIEDLLEGDRDEAGICRKLSQVIDTDPAYILFTSGSTGNPKGVVIPHRAINDYMEWSVEKFHITIKNNLASQAPFHFDASMPDIYTPLYTGSTLNLIHEKLFLFPMKLIEVLNRKKIDTLIWVPSALITLTNKNAFEKNKLDCLKLVMFCGEVMPNKHLNIWRRYHPDTVFVNLYGPTEAAYACTYFIVDRPFLDEQSLPIGAACENTEIFLLDDDQKKVTQPESIGEICIKGSCLALGYYKRSNHDSFIQNPLHNHYIDRIYKTGDLGSINKNGEYIYIGRRDFQIKHMGYRIELGEIEIAATALSYVNYACVLYDEENDEIILIYEGEDDGSPIKISMDLKDKLPKYMMPNRYFKVDMMPLNLNGKIDRGILKEKYILNK